MKQKIFIEKVLVFVKKTKTGLLIVLVAFFCLLTHRGGGISRRASLPKAPQMCSVQTFVQPKRFPSNVFHASLLGPLNVGLVKTNLPIKHVDPGFLREKMHEKTFHAIFSPSKPFDSAREMIRTEQRVYAYTADRGESGLAKLSVDLAELPRKQELLRIYFRQLESFCFQHNGFVILSPDLMELGEKIAKSNLDVLASQSNPSISQAMVDSITETMNEIFGNLMELKYDLGVVSCRGLSSQRSRIAPIRLEFNQDTGNYFPEIDINRIQPPGPPSGNQEKNDFLILFQDQLRADCSDFYLGEYVGPTSYYSFSPFYHHVDGLSPDPWITLDKRAALVQQTITCKNSIFKDGEDVLKVLQLAATAFRMQNLQLEGLLPVPSQDAYVATQIVAPGASPLKMVNADSVFVPGFVPGTLPDGAVPFQQSSADRLTPSRSLGGPARLVKMTFPVRQQKELRLEANPNCSRRQQSVAPLINFKNQQVNRRLRFEEHQLFPERIPGRPALPPAPRPVPRARPNEL